MSSDEDAEIVEAFLEESRENLDQLDQDLVALEADPSDSRLLAQVFRTIHTIKGTCGFLGFQKLESLSHAGESLLGALRSGDVLLDPPITTTLLRLVDATRATLDRIETTGAEGDADHAAIVRALTAHLEGGALPEAPGDVQLEAPLREEHLDTAGVAVTAETSVRVDVTVLDKLMDLVGELVQARNQIAEVAGEDEDGPLTDTYRQLRLATGELQEGVMRARLQPIGTVTSKFRRVVRDLAVDLGKQVHIEIEGEDVGVDKAVNEALAGPLLHLVRNAVDHGIEAPEVRAATGKPVEGSIHIRAFHEGGRVNVEIRDDGAGIDKQRLIAQAVANGVVSEAAVPGLTETDVFDLMFQPGLSTKSEVTSVSGRGVGLDVVRSSLEQFGGTVEVTSEAGRGCLFHLSVPLTLAIMPALVASCDGERYTIPQVDVEEVLHLDADAAPSEIHQIEGASLYRLRGQLLALVELSSQLGGPPTSLASGVTIVVVATTGRRFGLVVSSVGEMTEAVVKPLPSAVRSVPAFVGVTILGDGQPSLILDVAGVANLAGIAPVAAAALGGRADGRNHPDEAIVELGSSADLLVAVGVDGRRLAVRLASVRRLERFDAGSIEHGLSHDVVHYGNSILPLIYSGERRNKTSDASVQTLVCESAIGLVGLVVERIDDIVAEPAALAQPPSRFGVSTSLVLDERVTEVVDLEALVIEAKLGQA